VFQQLALSLALRDDSTFDSFLMDGNEEVVVGLKEFIGNKENFIYIHGCAGSGKTHILQSLCNLAIDCEISTVYLPMHECSSPDIIFDNLEHTNLICIDDLDVIFTKNEWEESIFHLYNKIKQNKQKLIVTAQNSVNLSKINLPDLKSRLAWGISYKLSALNEEQCLAAIKLRAKFRGIELGCAEGNYLIRRCTRNMQELFSTLEKLDRASLREKRKITIPFIKKILDL
jgi:DnaA-homolog protein